MRKTLLLMAILLPILIIAWCGKTPEEKAAANLARGWLWFMQDIVNIWETAQNGEISNEDVAKNIMWKYADFVADSADGTEDELNDEEKDMLHDMFTDPEKTIKIMNETNSELIEENER